MEKKTVSARQVALNALVACEKQGAWSDGILRNTIRSAGLDKRDAALCTRICYGVQQNLLLLNFWIDSLSSVKVKKLEPAVAGCIRIGMYQIRFMDKIPESAAVNESVELAKKVSKNRRSSGLVNGVLRSFIRQQDSLPMPRGGERLSILYSHPQWLVDLFTAELGSGVEELLKADNSEPPTCIQVNTLKTTAVKLMLELEEAGVSAEPHPWLKNCFLVTRTGSLENLPAFAEGRFTVQDAAARTAVNCCGIVSGDRVLDVCAAPGGKSFAAAMEMENQGEIISCDIHPHKQKLIEEGAARLGITCLTACTRDGKELKEDWAESFDKVILDVPCSGLGIIRKKPDIRYKDPKPLEGLPKVQEALLETACRYVRPGGVLLYATCTVLTRENRGQVDRFLKAHPEFTAEPFTLPQGEQTDGMVTLWPHIHGTDGFFFAKLRREE